MSEMQQQVETTEGKSGIIEWLFSGFFTVTRKYSHLPSWQKWVIGLICLFGIYRFLPIWELFKIFAYIVFAPLVVITICLVLFEDMLCHCGFSFKDETFSAKWEACLRNNFELLNSLWAEKFNQEVTQVMPPVEQAEEVEEGNA